MKLILTGLAALYLAGFVVMTGVYVVKFNGLLKKSRMDLNLNGASVPMAGSLWWLVNLGIYVALVYQAAKRAVIWPWSMMEAAQADLPLEHRPHRYKMILRWEARPGIDDFIVNRT